MMLTGDSSLKMRIFDVHICFQSDQTVTSHKLGTSQSVI